MIDKLLAKKIMQAVAECTTELNELAREAPAQGDDAATKKFKSRLGLIMGLLFTEIMKPIGDEHPDLYPRKLKRGSERRKRQQEPK